MGGPLHIFKVQRQLGLVLECLACMNYRPKQILNLKLCRPKTMRDLLIRIAALSDVRIGLNLAFSR